MVSIVHVLYMPLLQESILKAKKKKKKVFHKAKKLC